MSCNHEAAYLHTRFGGKVNFKVNGKLNGYHSFKKSFFKKKTNETILHVGKPYTQVLFRSNNVAISV